METKPAPDTEAAAEGTGRPRSVDLAVGAILLRCVLALAAALVLFGAKDELRREGAKLHPEWSAATLADRIDGELRSNMVLTVIYIGLMLLLAKFLRDGRNWARWLYAFFALLVAGDVQRIAGFFSGENLLFRLLSGLTCVAAAVAIVLLFTPSAGGYFKPAGAASVSPLRTLFGGGAAFAAERVASRQPGQESTGTSGATPVSLDKAGPVAGDRAGLPADRPAGSRRAPRAKSRKQASE